MNAQSRRPVVLAIAGATLLTAGGVALLLRAIPGNPEAARRSSLVELLEEGGRRRDDRAQHRQPLPPPPPQEAWVSPLRQACPIREPALQRHLAALLANLEQRRQRVKIHATNFGPRYRRDVYGNRVDPTPTVVVLHETVYGLESALNTFQTAHPNDADQVSYHTLIGQDGRVVDTVPPTMRAFGAGYSAFAGRWVKTSRKVNGSINNFALHLSLESPLDGENEAPSHSGYTSAQYDAMAVVLADWLRRYPIAVEAITTHRHVDLGRERADPRSFDWSKLRRRLAALGVIC